MPLTSTRNAATASQKAELMLTEVPFYDSFKPKFQTIIHPQNAKDNFRNEYGGNECAAGLLFSLVQV